MSGKINYIDTYNIASYNKSLALLYRSQSSVKKHNFIDSVVMMSAHFLGRPYVLGAAGEGHEGEFDQAPLYRFDGFDCLTYVNTALALALAHDVISFRKQLLQIGYRNAELAYANRHHFMSVDWNMHNQSLGLVKDVTPDILDASGKSIVEYAEALIDRPSWFRHRTYEDIRLLRKVSSEKEENLLNAIHNIANTVESEKSRLPYLPLKAMFDAKANPKESILEQIPHGSIIEIVRPNWDLKAKIGTNLNVSHVGFAVKKERQLFYRQASSIEKCVCDIPLIDYLRNRLESPSIKGINVQQILNHG